MKEDYINHRLVKTTKCPMKLSVLLIEISQYSLHFLAVYKNKGQQEHYLFCNPLRAFVSLNS